jgi:hypothetical protein
MASRYNGPSTLFSRSGRHSTRQLLYPDFLVACHERAVFCESNGGGGGNRTPVRESSISVTTCLADALISLLEPPAAGSLGASRFGFQPHPLRQETQPIPLNDALSNPVGEGR